ncbi:MAG: hypothetical protein KH376_11125, partial [Holdemanella biformis]|nr:hypothetical protein [Holdemanella biformis]
MGLNLNVSFICDKKTEQIINSFQFQVLDDLKFALSTSYDKYSFNKCQVEQDLLVITHEMIFKISRFKIIYFFMHFNSVLVYTIV